VIIMSLWKLAKAVAKDRSEDVNDVYNRLLKNRKKVRRMEGRLHYVEDNKERGEYNSS